MTIINVSLAKKDVLPVPQEVPVLGKIVQKDINLIFSLAPAINAKFKIVKIVQMAYLPALNVLIFSQISKKIAKYVRLAMKNKKIPIPVH